MPQVGRYVGLALCPAANIVIQVNRFHARLQFNSDIPLLQDPPQLRAARVQPISSNASITATMRYSLLVATLFTLGLAAPVAVPQDSITVSPSGSCSTTSSTADGNDGDLLEPLIVIGGSAFALPFGIRFMSDMTVQVLPVLQTVATAQTQPALLHVGC